MIEAFSLAALGIGAIGCLLYFGVVIAGKGNKYAGQGIPLLFMLLAAGGAIGMFAPELIFG